MMRVIKIGGRVQRDPALAGVLARLWAAAPAGFCVVHGGGETISALQAQLGSAPRFVEGRRVTTNHDIDVLRMALSGVANKRLVSSLGALGAPAVGISGEDGSLLVARAMNAAVLGRVGEVSQVNDALPRALLAAGVLPVISPVAAIAASFDAEELLLISDVRGVMIDGAMAQSLTVDEAAYAIESGIATEGMATKLRAALEALHRGVPRVRIGGLDALSGPGPGTTLLAATQLA